jgi:hypothetical protein
MNIEDDDFSNQLIENVSNKYSLDLSWFPTIEHVVNNYKRFIQSLTWHLDLEDAVMIVILANNIYINDPELLLYKSLCKGRALDRMLELFNFIHTINSMNSINMAINAHMPISGIHDIFKSFHKVDPIITSKLVLMGIVTPTNRGN